MGVKF